MLLWTDDQLKAIEATKGSLLVSAAAGSGKTAVLVERVIRRITDSQSPCDIDSLLIVTFTKAAAAQMRERIGQALAALISKNPKDLNLQRQQVLLPFAKISTIDSFCNELVRENFHLTDMGPDFAILSQSEAAVLKAEASDSVIESLYSKDEEAAKNLLELLIERGGRENALKNAILKTYDEARAHPFDEDYYKDLLEPFLNVKTVDESPWGQAIRRHVLEIFSYCVKGAMSLLDEISLDQDVYKSYAQAVKADLVLYTSLFKAAQTAAWDNLYQAMRALTFERLKPCRSEDESLRERAKIKRNLLKKTASEAESLVCANSQEHLEDMEYLSPLALKYVETVKNFAEEYDRLKSKNNYADFADVMHTAINLLLVKTQEGRVEKTALAEELSKKYEEILVDEYQDVNRAQDMIFSVLSRKESNLFFVGDVKQSIYGFRNAMPEIFLKRREKLPLYEDENYPARVVLGKNFRSRKGVTGMVNFIFSQLMSRQAGDVDYDEDEALIPAANYPPLEEAEVSLHLINSKEAKDERKDLDKDEFQANYIAGLIKDMISSGLTISEKGQTRRATYRDFCILLRSVKNKASLYAQELEKQKIPAYSELSGGFFEAQEIAFMLSLLRVLDNPLQDVALLSIMLSPVFGFSTDELALMRSEDRKIPLYNSVSAWAGAGSEKAADFLERTQQMRRLASTLSASELLRRLMEETGYMALVASMDKGPKRRANLYLLLEYAAQYEAAGHIGLSGFIRFIDKLAQSEEDLAPALELPETADVVRIMSVHKSKGLEFPICILAACETSFNMMDARGSMVSAFGCGLGFVRKIEQPARRFDTLSSRAVKLAASQNAKAEEMRVLYVALTRAKEHLIMVSDLANPESKLLNLAAELDTKELAPFSVLSKNSFSDWILSAALRHPDAQSLRDMAEVENLPVLQADFRLKLALYCENPEEDKEIEKEESKLDEALLERIDRRLSYRYPYLSLDRVVAKRAASDLDDSGLHKAYFASSRPAFISKKRLTAAQRGTALHKFMEFSDYNLAKSDPETERERLLGLGFLNKKEAESLDLKKISLFFESDLAKRLFKSSKVMREKKFTIRVAAGELYPDLDLPPQVSGENVVVQGIVDCAFVEDGKLVLLDYKTDKVQNARELLEKYSSQLAVYKKALEMVTGLKVGESYIYSFELGQAITAAN
ncbi:MAG: helicase-exonuclease AddAB subunit AddA [Clostridiales bacterium]|nr:helicase-exonuclease AddAB subunit AddA [Clostridiales bacterium]